MTSGDGCNLVEHTENGYFAVTIENDSLSVTILPGKGADIHRFVSKAHGLDLLWKSPWHPRRQHGALALAEAGSEAAWLDQYAGGWQWIFPNGGDACIYKGASLSFHGEASVREWDYTVRRCDGSAVEVQFRLATSRGPFHLVRTMRIERGLPVLLLDDTIENRGEEDMHYMWGHHPAFGAPFLDGGCRLTVPASRFVAHGTEISKHSRFDPGAAGSWPVALGKSGVPVDLSVLPPVKDRVTEFGYLSGLDAGWYALQNDRLNVGFALAWPKEVFPFVWLWEELRGSFGYPWYGRSYVAAFEPFSSMPGSGLVKAIESGTAPVLNAGAKAGAQVTAVLLTSGHVASVSLDGTVRLDG